MSLIHSSTTLVYPEDLFEDASPQSADRLWRVVHTKPRQEKRLASELAQLEIPFFLPHFTKASRVGGRRTQVSIPLFTGYMFLFCSPEERIATLQTLRTVRVIDVVDQSRLMNDLSGLHLLLQSGLPVLPQLRLEPGTAVEIQSGPLKGMVGTILRGSRRRSFVVQVNFLQRGAAVILDESDLAKPI